MSAPATTGRVRDFLDSLSFVLRNKRRTNLLLGLVRNHLNGIDVERQYFQLLRNHLEASGGWATFEPSTVSRCRQPRRQGAPPLE